MALNLGLITAGIPGWQQLSGAVATTYAKVCHFGRQVQKHIGGGNTYMVRHDFEYGSSKKYTSEDFTRFMAVAESDLADYQQSGDQQFLTRARQYTDFIEDECPDSMKFRAKQLRAKYKLQSAKQLFADYQKGGSGSSKSLLLASSAAKEAFQQCQSPEKEAAQALWVDCLLEEIRLSLVSCQNETEGKVDDSSLRLARESIEKAERHCLASQRDAVQAVKVQIADAITRHPTPGRITELMEATETYFDNYMQSGDGQLLHRALSSISDIIDKCPTSMKWKAKQLQGRIKLELAKQHYVDYQNTHASNSLCLAESAAEKAVNQCPESEKEAARTIWVICLLENAKLNLASFLHDEPEGKTNYGILRCAKENIENAEKHCLACQMDEVQALKKDIMGKFSRHPHF